MYEKNGKIRMYVERMWSLAYADDIVLSASSREALQDIMCTSCRFYKERVNF